MGEIVGKVGEGSAAAGARGLTAEDQELYKALAAGEHVRGGVDLSRLTAAGLVDESPYESGCWLAMDPRAAIQRVLEAEQERLAASLQRLADIPVLEGLAPAYERTRRFDSMGSEFLATKRLMNERIGEVTGKSSVELLAAQPVLAGPPRPRDSQAGHGPEPGRPATGCDAPADLPRERSRG